MENPIDEHAELVKVFDTEQESEALIVHGLLESAGIQSQMTSLNLQQDVYPGLSGVILRVSASQAEEARAVIAQYSAQPLKEDEVVEEPFA
jgi:hypothetical protein